MAINQRKGWESTWTISLLPELKLTRMYFTSLIYTFVLYKRKPTLIHIAWSKEHHGPNHGPKIALRSLCTWCFQNVFDALGSSDGIPMVVLRTDLKRTMFWGPRDGGKNSSKNKLTNRWEDRVLNIRSIHVRSLGTGNWTVNDALILELWNPLLFDHISKKLFPRNLGNV